MQIPTIAAMYPPRRMLIYRGINADRSLPAETEFAAILTPSWANANASPIKNTPTRVAVLGLSLRKLLRRSSGF
jgi:hypothetical protein